MFSPQLTAIYHFGTPHSLRRIRIALNHPQYSQTVSEPVGSRYIQSLINQGIKK